MTRAPADASATPAGVRLVGVTRRFGPRLALAGVDLEVPEGELLAVLGPSGSGKSTALRVVAGLERPTSGRVEIGGRDVTALAPHRRDVAMVFQDAALFPHLTVRGNLGFGPAVRRVPPARVRERVEQVAAVLGLGPLLDLRPEVLSGGERQRVALARALLREPRVILLDEPLTALDPALRAGAREEVLAVHRRLGATTLCVTHDPDEAMTLGDRLAVVVDGRVQQTGLPQQVYDEPVSLTVARLLGPLSLVPLSLLVLSSVPLSSPAAAAARPAGTVLGVRPEDVHLEPAGDAADGPSGAPADARDGLAAVVTRVEPVGAATLLHLELREGAEPTGEGAPRLLARAPARSPWRPGDRVRVRLGRTTAFDGDSGARCS